MGLRTTAKVPVLNVKKTEVVATRNRFQRHMVGVRRQDARCRAPNEYNALVFPLMCTADFDAKPIVLFFGQYPTGKTRFINCPLNRDHPDSKNGPEPTTEGSWRSCRRDDDDPGQHSLRPGEQSFQSLSRLSNDVMAKFNRSFYNCPLREPLTSSTYGVLSGEAADRAVARLHHGRPVVYGART